MTPLDLLQQAFPRADTPADTLQVLLGLVLALVTALLAGHVVRFTGHPVQRLGRILYLDAPEYPTLVRQDLLFSGRPDFVVQTGFWWWKHVRPVEFKTGKPPNVPYAGHVLQLAGYGLLIEGEVGHYPRHGYIVYEEGSSYRLHKVRLGPQVAWMATQFVKAIASGDCYPQSVPVDGRCTGCRQAAACPVLHASDSKALRTVERHRRVDER